MGQKIKLQTLVHIHQIVMDYWILHILYFAR